ncbi:uncharacterized protein BKA55DRAFT_697726 [Fusarium redolens]|uniref:Uncharacterized protein n=1 Tax=Fusarium redolens TaxID=48865 RepID=A0A9P9FWN5_FUSRE|nr:uncharacterized protein BKA55DRAFT_697726 [Fusarium redolens]KAH7217022.1 hypothetical protein BKA55DRAFT_697726 [Fusarium redolens]
MRKYIIFLLLLFPTVSLSLSKRGCQNFKPEFPHDCKGVFAKGSPIRVSELVICTAERAEEDGHDGKCNIQRSKIGIIANSTITRTNNGTLKTSLEAKRSILEAVRDAASPKALEHVNLKRLVVMPFTAPSLMIPKGKRGY